ncbi:lecithin-cholesterol acyltransferase-like 1 [Triticum aestivum]|uniref:lecithin-cholesterol acyltransferase-like 1 n=1 Tax=Triticum aestivum TaxID=4565 RepID=UPI001D010D16|nr:lecithin-cholesterol acyltransferase-like 1 [Triticum aestivum]
MARSRGGGDERRWRKQLRHTRIGRGSAVGSPEQMGRCGRWHQRLDRLMEVARELSLSSAQEFVEALERIGYRDGQNLFGAPYDLRYAAPVLGLPSREFSMFCGNLTALVEHASSKNRGKPVFLVSHSQGGQFALEFLSRSPLAWRRRLVKHFFMASTGTGGIVVSMKGLASKDGGDVMSTRRVRRSFASAFDALPSPTVFGDETPLVVTRARDYTARDMPEFLSAIGLPESAVGLYLSRALPVALNLRAPLVPMTCINGVGVATPEKLVYWDSDLGKDPEVVYGDGDGAVNLAGILALDTVIGHDPAQSGCYRSIKMANTTHAGVVSDGLAVDRLIDEILEANRATETCVLATSGHSTI